LKIYKKSNFFFSPVATGTAEEGLNTLKWDNLDICENYIVVARALRKFGNINT